MSSVHPMKDQDEGATQKQWLANNLRKARENARVTQLEVAQQAGHHSASISDWERGTRAPSIFALLTLADAYGISLDQLVRGEESPYNQPVAVSAGVGSEDMGAIRSLLKNAKRILQERPGDPKTASRVTATIEAAEMLTES